MVCINFVQFLQTDYTYTVWRKILTVENFDESGFGKF